MYVTKLELWNDTGFVENSAEYPNLSDTLTNPDFTYTDLHPAKEDLFSYFKIKGVSYETLISVSYARVTYDNLSYPVYMWVDSVACISDTSTKLTAVSCHVDLWRTYLGDASLGYGLITKRIRGTADPIQSCPYRYRTVAFNKYDLVPSDLVGGQCYWAIINYAAEDKTGETVTSKTIVSPVAKAPDTQFYFKETESSTVYKTPKLNEWVLGEYDEIFGIAPTAISSAFLSPVPPFKFSKGTGTDEDPFILVSDDGTQPEDDPDVKTGSFPRVQKWITGTHFGDVEGGIVSYTPLYVDYSDGSSQKAGNFSTAGVRGGITKMYGSSQGCRVRTSGAIEITATETAPIFAISLDDFVRTILGDNVFNNLTDKDTFEITSTVTGVYSSVSFAYASNTGGSTGTMLADLIITVNDATTSRSFTMAGGTFGAYTILMAGYPEKFTYKLTTYTSVIAAVDYDVVVSTVEKYKDYAYVTSSTGKYCEYSASLEDTLSTTDTEEWFVTDMSGVPTQTLPWGLAVKDYTFRVVGSSSSAYVQFRFAGLDSHATGLEISIPLPTLDINSNSWSEYVYSGQRDYDIQQRKIASQQALVSGITGGLQNTVSTAVMGGLGGINKGALNEADALFRDKAMASISSHPILGGSGATEEKFYNQLLSDYGSSMKGVRSAAQMTGKLAGGAMLGVSVGGSLVDYAAAQYFNGKLQGIEDTLQAKQIDSIITPGAGTDWLFYGRRIMLCKFVVDDYSLVNFHNNIQYNGITCSEPTADCSAYKDYTGPVQIQNLIVTGDIPVQAKYLIANTYAKGIRMKCVNEKPDYDITASSLLTTTSISADTYVLYNNTDYRYKINCVANDEIREQYIVEAGENVTVTLEAGDVISTLYYDKMWVANQNTVNVL